MKTILITVGSSLKARKLLWTDFLRVLKEIPDLRLVLIAPQNNLEFYREEFGSEKVIVDSAPEDPFSSRIDWLTQIVARDSIPTNSRKIRQYRYLYDTERSFMRKLANFVFARTFWYLSKLEIWREFLRFLYSLIPAGKRYDTVLERHKPDLVYATNILDSREFKLLKAAKKKGIKTVAQILTWDNLTMKLFICLKPDNFIVPTSLVKEELIHYGDYKNGKIFVVGIPQYDWYFEKKWIIPREKFLKQIGAAPDKKLILYACVGKVVSPKYSEIFEQLNEAVINKKIKYPAQVIIRLYPRYDLSRELKKKIKKTYKFLLDEPDVHVKGSTGDSFEVRKENIIHLANLIYHSDIVVTSYSTIVIEAAIFNKPVININYDGHKNRPYWCSNQRVREFEFYQGIIKTNGERGVNNKEELVQAINEYLENPELDKEGRAQMIKEQCYLTDGKSGQRMAKVILSLI